MKKVQVAIFGGGVAGLWLLNRLQQNNIASVLIENATLGGGQTVFSQGIIHGGVKYALQGKSTLSSEAMKKMPDIWRQCLKGEGEIDLSSVTVLSSYQYLWSPGSLGANVALFLASKNLKGQVSGIATRDYPAVFAHEDFKGALYRLEEPILAVPSLIQALAKDCWRNILKANLRSVAKQADVIHLQLESSGEIFTIDASQVVLLAGKGNEALAQQFSLSTVNMQSRPLHMVAVRSSKLPPFYGHAMQVSDKPRLTITSHPSDESMVWYVGGDLAETGVNRSQEEQIAFARQELIALFPRLDFADAKYQTFFIERAESLYEGGRKPEGPTIVQEANVIVAWPTKLAFSPLLSEEIMRRLVLSETFDALDDLAIETKPAIAFYPWETAS